MEVEPILELFPERLLLRLGRQLRLAERRIRIAPGQRDRVVKGGLQPFVLLLSLSDGFLLHLM